MMPTTFAPFRNGLVSGRGNYSGFPDGLMEVIPAQTRAQHPCSASVVGARKHSEETWRTRPMKVSFDHTAADS